MRVHLYRPRMPDETALEFYRPVAWADRYRAYEIEIDGRPAGVLRRKDSLHVPVRAGVRKVRARIGGTGSPVTEIEAKDGTTTRVQVGPAPGLAAQKLFRVDGWLLIAPDAD